MSRVKKRREEAPMPATMAGLLRFYDEESYGIKLRPEFIVAAAIALMLLVVLAPFYLPR
ncbi:MAG: preprotein translocase subunit Sec61beta [Candidatus Bathyarchaeia archaeon]